MAKRVNKRFLVGLTAVVLVGGVTAMLASYVVPKVFKKDPKEHVAESQRLEGEYLASVRAGTPDRAKLDDAIARYGKAVHASPKDAALRVGFGDLLDRHIVVDPQQFGGLAQRSWVDALAVDPRNRDAMNRLLHVARDYMDLQAGGRPDLRAFAEVQDAARRIEAADPGNVEAQAWRHIAVIRQAAADPVAKREDVEASVAALRALHEKAPANALAAAHVAQGELYLFEQATKRGPLGRRDVKTIGDRLEKWVPAMLEGQESNPEMQFYAGQIYRQMPAVEHAMLAAAAGGAATTRPTTVPANAPAGKYTDRVTAAYAAARKHAKLPKLEDAADKREAARQRDMFFTIQLASAQWLAQTGKADESRSLMEELVAAHGDEPVVRLQYVSQLRGNMELRPKLLDLLARPVPMDGYVGRAALGRKNSEIHLRLEAANLRLAAATEEQDVAARDRQLDALEAEASRLEKHVSPTSVPMLELRGRLHLARNRFAEAIPLLQQAVDLRGPSRDADTRQVMIQLAETYRRQGLSGQAEKMYADVVGRFPGFTAAYALRIHALLQDGRRADARRQLADLKKVAPNAQEIPGLEALVEGGEKYTALVERMPETTTDERVRKVQMLRADGKAEEAAALAERAVKADPKSLAARQLLVELYMAAGRRDDALALVNEAIAADPGNEHLKQWPAFLAERTPEETEQWILEQVRREPDPGMRELKLYELEMSRALDAGRAGDAAERKRLVGVAEGHLAAAEQAKPDDTRVMVARFGFLARERRFDEAEKVVQRLAAKNADQAQGHYYRYQLAMQRAAAAGDDVRARDAAQGAAEAAALEITRLRPQFDVGWTYLGDVMRTRGRYREAVQHYNTALERRGTNADALRGLAETHYAAGDLAAAKAVLLRAREALPRDPGFRERLLAHELDHGRDLAKIAAEREQIRKQEPNNAENIGGLADVYLRLSTEARDDAKRKELDGKARALLEDGRTRWPTDPRFHRSLAMMMLRDGDFLGGERLLKDFVAQPAVDDKVAGDLMLSEYYASAKKPSMAEQSLRDALEKTNGAPAIKVRLAHLLNETGRRADAVKELAGVPGPGAARLRVEVLLADNKSQEAEQALKEGLAANPGNLKFSDFAIDLLLANGRVAEVEPIVQQRLARSDADDQARYFGARLKLLKQPADVPGAIKDLTDLAERNPGSREVLTLLADTRAATNDIPGAIDELEKALRLDPLNRDLRLRMIAWSGRAKRWEVVRKLAAESAADPELGKDPTWNVELAKAYAATGKHADAEKAITKAISMVPAEQAAGLQREHLAVVYQSANYKRLLQLTGDMLAKGRTEWWVHHYRGLAKAGAKDKTAVQDFDKALAALDIEKQLGDAQYVVAEIARTAGADEALKRVAGWEEKDPRWRLVAADLCLRKGDMAAALTHLQPLEAEAGNLPQPVQAAFYRALAQAHHRMRPRPDFDKAIDAYKRYVKLEQGDMEALNNLAYLLAEEVSPARPQEAKPYSQAAFEMARGLRGGEDKARIYDTHGWVLVLNGGSDLDEGIRVLRQIVEGFPILEAHYHLGEAQLRKNRGAEAQAQFNAALAMIEKSKKAKQRYDETLEPRIRRGLESAKALGNAAAGAR